MKERLDQSVVDVDEATGLAINTSPRRSTRKPTSVAGNAATGPRVS